MEIDGEGMQVGDRVLLRGQRRRTFWQRLTRRPRPEPTNGIYEVAASSRHRKPLPTDHLTPLEHAQKIRRGVVAVARQVDEYPSTSMLRRFSDLLWTIGREMDSLVEKLEGAEGADTSS